jgi:hypothetical protein
MYSSGPIKPLCIYDAKFLKKKITIIQNIINLICNNKKKLQKRLNNNLKFFILSKGRI